MLEQRARETPDAPALDDGERRRSWGQLDDRVRRHGPWVWTATAPTSSPDRATTPRR